jgi:hypothetical protein
MADQNRETFSEFLQQSETWWADRRARYKSRVFDNRIGGDTVNWFSGENGWDLPSEQIRIGEEISGDDLLAYMKSIESAIDAGIDKANEKLSRWVRSRTVHLPPTEKIVQHEFRISYPYYPRLDIDVSLVGPQVICIGQSRKRPKSEWRNLLRATAIIAKMRRDGPIKVYIGAHAFENPADFAHWLLGAFLDLIPFDAIKERSY